MRRLDTVARNGLKPGKSVRLRATIVYRCHTISFLALEATPNRGRMAPSRAGGRAMKLNRRIVISMLSVVAISGGASGTVGGYLLWRHLHQQAQTRVRQDLNAAREFYDARLEAMAMALRYTALGERFSQAVAGKQVSYLAPRLEAVRKRASLDILYVTDDLGRVIHRDHRREVSGDSVADDRLVQSVLDGKDVSSATLLVPMEVLAKEAPSLAEQAKLTIRPTPKATPPGRAEVDSGMMLCSAVPVRAADGRLVGVLRAGILLTHNYELVDYVHDTVFGGERYRGRPFGTVTIFQHGVRISTNVLKEDGSRAIGTSVSAQVQDHVLRQNKRWLGRAWVVNDWYVSAYAPIHDIDGKTVGMLYVGVLERKFTDTALSTLLTFALVTLLGLAAAGLLGWKLANAISRPARALAVASQAVARGDFSESVQAPARASDEITALTETFNAMARSLRERDKLLQERTRLQLTRSERLAAVGRLAAGVAHEINNPLTGALTFSHMLLSDAPEGSQQRKDIETIIEATTRCRDIVRGLLNFSRQNEPQKTLADLNDVLADALSLTRNQARINKVAIVEEMDPNLPGLVIDPHQIQEVAVNLSLNAIDAMADGGTLTVRTRCTEEGGRKWVEFEVSDTGCGIAEKDLEHVFDPFFTTKPPGEGTGLGLAISYGIVAEHGADIHVASQVNCGTTVTVRLPIATEELGDEDKAASTSSR